MNISPQMIKINQLRAILQPSEVEKEKFPRWFRLRGATCCHGSLTTGAGR